MARRNQIIENPVIGDRCQFLVTAQDSQGQLLKIEVSTKAGAIGPPEHYHPLQRETFEVVKGKLGLKENGKEFFLLPGQSYTISPNVLHKWWNAGEEDLLVNVELSPALKTEYFLETMYSLADQGKVKKDSLPKSFFQFAAILHEYYGELFVVGPPIAAQKVMAKVVGSIGKLLGYKGFVPFRES